MDAGADDCVLCPATSTSSPGSACDRCPTEQVADSTGEKLFEPADWGWVNTQSRLLGAARLRQAYQDLEADAHDPDATGQALIAIAAERLANACPALPCGGLARTAPLAPPRPTDNDHIIFFMNLGPPSDSLFPYTTMFRC